jgi:hypothetical protein
MSGEGPTTTSNTNSVTRNSSNVQQSLPDWFLNEWQSLLGQGNSLNNSLLTPVAGIMPDQEAASWLQNSALQDFMNRQQVPAYDVFGMGQNWDQGPLTATLAAGTGMGLPSTTAAQASPASATSAQLAPGAIAPFMSPFIDTALNPALNRLKTQQGEVQAGIGANAAASGMFGGSREAVQRMLADRNYRETAGSTAGNMLLQGWQQASGLAGANVDREQATRLANAGFEQQAAITNAQLATQAALGDTQAGVQLAAQQNQIALANAAAQNTMAQRYQDLSYQGSQADADRFLRAVGQQQQMDASDFSSTMAGIGGLNQLGTQQQQTAQRALDYYWQQLTQLQNLLKLVNPGMNTSSTGTTVGNTTGTSTQTKPTDWASILLGGAGLAGKFLSDREDKTDIKKLGKDPDTGIPMYAYRYKDDPKSYPKVVGPMADDLERFLPGITKLIGGHQVVKLR